MTRSLPAPSKLLTRSHLLRAALAASLGVPGIGMSGRTASARDDEQIATTISETATIDGRTWDTALVGGRTIDAVHRSVLLRFPGAADQIALALREGRVLAKAELSLAYEGYEIVPEGYLCRPDLGRGKVGLLRLEYRPWAKECDVTCALKVGQDAAGLARTIAISGLAEAPRVTLNGRAVEVQSEGRSESRAESRSSGRTFRIPLAGS